MTKLFFSVVLFLSFLDPVSALGFEEPLEKMIRRADLVFIGTLVEIKTYKLTETIKPYGHDKEKTAVVRSLYTDYVLEISEILKGDYESSVISINQLGGFHGGKRQFWSSSYFLELDSQYVVIAVRKESDPNAWVSTSGGQGVLRKYEVDGSTHLRNVNRDHVINKDTGTFSETESELTVEEFLQKVKEVSK